MVNFSKVWSYQLSVYCISILNGYLTWFLRMEIQFESTVIEIHFHIIIIIFNVHPLKCYISATVRAILNLSAPCGRVFSVFWCKGCNFSGKVYPIYPLRLSTWVSCTETNSILDNSDTFLCLHFKDNFQHGWYSCVLIYSGYTESQVHWEFIMVKKIVVVNTW